MKVKLIIANTFVDTVCFNYGDDYSDITRVIVEDHSPFEEIEGYELDSLKAFVCSYNLDKANKGKFAFVIEKGDEISAKSAIAEIKEKTEKMQAERIKKGAEARKKKEEKAAADKAAKEYRTLEQKRKQLEKLKKELGEQQ